MVQDFSTDAAARFRQVMAMLRPHSLKGGSKVRIGRHYDGGYIMVDDFSGVEAAYSLGINDDVSWDLDIAQRGIPVFQYDHTIEGLPCEHPMFKWRRLGVSGKANPEGQTETLETMLEQNGHSQSRNLLLKCDVENSEWDVLTATPQAVIRRFSQIVLELHDMHHVGEPQFGDGMRRSISNLYASHRVVHIHANNYGGGAIVGGYPVPCVVEVTLARLDMGEFSPSNETFPTAMDMPCNKDAADMFLGRFEFS